MQEDTVWRRIRSHRDILVRKITFLSHIFANFNRASIKTELDFGNLIRYFHPQINQRQFAIPAETSSGRGYFVELIVVLVMDGIFSTMGYLFGVTRIYFYGWMIGLANLASTYMSHNAGWTFHIPNAISAGIILIIGFVLLVRFLRKYPMRTEEA